MPSPRPQYSRLHSLVGAPVRELCRHCQWRHHETIPIYRHSGLHDRECNDTETCRLLQNKRFYISNFETTKAQKLRVISCPPPPPPNCSLKQQQCDIVSVHVAGFIFVQPQPAQTPWRKCFISLDEIINSFNQWIWHRLLQVLTNSHYCPLGLQITIKDPQLP